MWISVLRRVSFEYLKAIFGKENFPAIDCAHLRAISNASMGHFVGLPNIVPGFKNDHYQCLLPSKTNSILLMVKG